ncbi:2-hydroxyacid dehydrogenase [Litchfieldia alkalitelluris]|uniref:2-hydroxyacid dehydrogenase n=1 Tax=Litchfieldia alkalitelluris TaxID=304268 RepID=UPI000996FCF9|nr:D-glycerate dehydrogenase [Litchfieldia alkalitelluris]
MKQRIYITRKISNEIVEWLKQFVDVKMWMEEETPVPRAILQKEIREVDGLYCLLTEQVDRELINQANNLKVISNMAVGYNNIDIEYAAKKGIAVTNTPGVLTETTADLTFSLLMATARRLGEAEQFLREGKWTTWSPMLLTGQDIYGTTLGIIGLGRIGEAVARRAKGFGMKIIYYNRNRKPNVERELNLTYYPFEELLKTADYICILTPFTDETKNLIDEREFKLMKPNTILINTSRGGIVNEEALYKALSKNQIWGAGLDVFDEEPISADHPLLSLKNVVVTPHIGSASIQTRMRMAKLAAENLISVLQKKQCSFIVN